MKNTARQIIKTLEDCNFYISCPCGCGEDVRLKDAGLFYLDDFTEGAYSKYQEMLQEIRDRKVNMRTRPERGAKAVNIGLAIEQIVPAFKTFPFTQNDCRFISEPIDYIIFEGLTKNGTVSKILFSDVKTGNAKLLPRQKQIKELVDKKKVKYKTY